MGAGHLAIAALLLTAISLRAQQSNSNNDQQMQGMQNMQGMQMNNGQMQHGQKMSHKQMMQGCQKNMQSMMASNAQTTKDIDAAKQSNDPTKMRAALDEAEKALSPMNEHMKTCVSMMNMMSMMQNKQGMGMMGGENQKPQTSPKQ